MSGAWAGEAMTLTEMLEAAPESGVVLSPAERRVLTFVRDYQALDRYLQDQGLDVRDVRDPADWHRALEIIGLFRLAMVIERQACERMLAASGSLAQAIEAVRKPAWWR